MKRIINLFIVLSVAAVACSEDDPVTTNNTNNEHQDTVIKPDTNKTINLDTVNYDNRNSIYSYELYYYMKSRKDTESIYDVNILDTYPNNDSIKIALSKFKNVKLNLNLGNCSSLLTIPPFFADSIIDNIYEIRLPDNVSIHTNAFLGCSNLAWFDVSENNVNYTCEDGIIFNKEKSQLIMCPRGKLGKYNMPHSVKSISKDAFQFCKKVNEITLDTIFPIHLQSWCGFEGTFLVPSYTLELYKSTDIWKDHFNQLKGFDKERDWLYDFELYSFMEEQTDLERIHIAKIINPVPNFDTMRAALWKFENVKIDLDLRMCTRLEKIPMCAFGVDDYVLCHSLYAVELPESITEICAYAFRYSINLKTIIVPKNVKKLWWESFYGCTNLQEVILQEGLEIIDDQCFLWCENLKSINLPNSLIRLGSGSLRGCDALTYVKIPSSISKIENCTFMSCDNLKKIDIPESVTEIGALAFDDCINLESIIFPNGLTEFKYSILGGCEKLLKLNIPSQVISIDHSFNNCKNLQSIDIPNKVREIIGYAFQGCYSLESITLPESLERIGPRAFAYNGLKSMTLKGTTPPVFIKEGDEMFSDDKLSLNEDCTIYVPISAVNDYKNADIWNLYSDKIVGY